MWRRRKPACTLDRHGWWSVYGSRGEEEGCLARYKRQSGTAWAILARLKARSWRPARQWTVVGDGRAMSSGTRRFGGTLGTSLRSSSTVQRKMAREQRKKKASGISRWGGASGSSWSGSRPQGRWEDGSEQEGLNVDEAQAVELEDVGGVFRRWEEHGGWDGGGSGTARQWNGRAGGLIGVGSLFAWRNRGGWMVAEMEMARVDPWDLVWPGCRRRRVGFVLDDGENREEGRDR